MPTIVDFPTIVKEALEVFGDLFENEPERRHFAEYLTGLMVAESKTVSGINREFVVTTDQSCLNRWLTEVNWDVHALNDRRLEWLQRDPKTRYSRRGVIAIDNVLVDHEGKLKRGCGLAVGSCRPALCDCSRLSDFQLRVPVGSALSDRVATVQKAGGVCGRGVPRPHKVVYRVD